MSTWALNNYLLEFYCIGKLTPTDYKQHYRTINEKEQSIVNFTFKIDTEVKDEMYSYFTDD